jgi:hypothetical protein
VVQIQRSGSFQTASAITFQVVFNEMTANTDPTVFSPDVTNGTVTLLQAGTYLIRVNIFGRSSAGDGFWQGSIFNTTTNTSINSFTIVPLTATTYLDTPSSPELVFTASAGTTIAVRFVNSAGGTLAIRPGYSGMVIEKIA